MMEKIYNNTIKETCLKYVHKSGVTVYMLPMEGVSTAVAQFTAKFGSQDNEFSVNGGNMVKIPDGTAHYLEHKLFESEEKDAFALFAETGASCNAGTSFDYTQYYFACADKFSKNLEILLNFVQEPYFTPENVEKERGIIGQEITMYRDNPSWRVFTNLLEGIYHVNPVRLDIAGTVESISKITPDTLYDCYNAFYNPANMYLCVAGNFNPDEVAQICDKRLKDRAPLNVKTAEFNRPLKVSTPRVTLKMPVAKPIFELGLNARRSLDRRRRTSLFITIFLWILCLEKCRTSSRICELKVYSTQNLPQAFSAEGIIISHLRAVKAIIPTQCWRKCKSESAHSRKPLHQKRSSIV